jgi:hypothetical protein
MNITYPPPTVFVKQKNIFINDRLLFILKKIKENF